MANFDDFDSFDNGNDFEDRDFDESISSVCGSRRAGPDANDVYGDFE